MHQEDKYYVIDNREDFIGWDILNIEHYKPGVKRVTMRKMNPDESGSVMIVFAKDKYVEGLSTKKDKYAL